MGKKRFLNQLFPLQPRYRIRFKNGAFRETDNFTDMDRNTLPPFDYVIDYKTACVSTDGINWRDNTLPTQP